MTMAVEPQNSQGTVTLIHHAANRNHSHPAGSISAIRSCLEAGAWAVEIDILPITDGSFALLHDQNLDETTNGKGNASTSRREDLELLRYRQDGALTDEKVGFLDEVIPLVAQNQSLGKLQLDLKPYTALTPALIQKIMDLISPVKKCVQISSIADWSVRTLHHFSAELSLGFDPLLYLDVVDQEPRPATVPPFRVGAYGLRDDHPLSAYIWGSKRDYFWARAEALFAQVVPGCEWFIRAETLLAAYENGFDWVEFLHERSCKVDAWTLEPQGESAKMAEKLAALGVDEITTNDTVGMAKILTRPCRV
jgi:glycerophosphoryl diester phosphodiesterase